MFDLFLMALFCTLSCFVHMQKQLSENVFIDERRPVLLCDGKLCLRALQDLFNLTIVEMMYGMCSLLSFFFCLSVWCLNAS